MLATNATELYIGRTLSGLTAGGSINLMILFVAELADDKWVNYFFLISWKEWLNKSILSRYRGRIGSILPLSLNIGILALFVSDIFLSFMEIGSIALALLFLFLCFFAFFPDTPKQLYKIRKQEVNNLNFFPKFICFNWFSFQIIRKEAIESLQVYRDIRDLQCQTDECYKVEVKLIRNLLKSEAGINVPNGI